MDELFVEAFELRKAEHPHVAARAADDAGNHQEAGEVRAGVFLFRYARRSVSDQVVFADEALFAAKGRRQRLVDRMNRAADRDDFAIFQQVLPIDVADARRVAPRRPGVLQRPKAEEDDHAGDCRADQIAGPLKDLIEPIKVAANQARQQEQGQHASAQHRSGDSAKKVTTSAADVVAVVGGDHRSSPKRATLRRLQFARRRAAARRLPL
ncbi:hypothetical protein C5Y93_21090 [Blastopirellula marina]|uniref:Uncharacterized protein n=1 Tax=Blastopirellula marina TaxID=124 RepID=A0A2S8GHU8_9BACT|nr:hypothetical protein C5Y93_21090 [Blastopirellula marina]